MSARPMSMVDAGDIAVGQVWWDATNQTPKRKLYRVGSVNAVAGEVQLRPVGGGEKRPVSFGSLLAYWVLVDEAAS